MTLMLSKYVIAQQAEVLAVLLRESGSMRLYDGAQPDISTRTEGRLVECKLSEITVEGATLTIKYDAGTVTKEGSASYFRLVSGNIPVLSDTISELMMPDRELKIGTIVSAGEMTHSVFKA